MCCTRENTCGCYLSLVLIVLSTQLVRTYNLSSRSCVQDVQEQAQEHLTRPFRQKSSATCRMEGKQQAASVYVQPSGAALNRRQENTAMIWSCNVQVTKKLILACSLAFAFMIFECVGGYFSQSVAILADAAHMFSDVFSFVVSIYCMRLINMKATSTYSFGYHRAETMGALISVLIVCVITGGLVLEAIQRLVNPTPIDGKLMFIVATTGIGFNVLLLLTLGHDHHHHMGGSCNHDHGHSHGHGHAQSSHHSHDHGCDHQGADHGHAAHDVSAAGGCNGSQGHDHAHDDQMADGASGARCSYRGRSDHGHDHDHDHDHDHEHGHSCAASKGAHGMECLGVETSSSSSGAMLNVKIQAPETSDSLQQLRLDCASTSHACAHGHHHSHSHGAAGGHHDHDNQNLRGAIVHVLGDILQSVGVAVAGAILWYTDSDPKWLWVDPVCTFIFAMSVVWVTKTLIVDITQDLMEGSPNDIDVGDLTTKILSVPGVTGIHDLHVWRIGTGKVILTAHIDVADKSDPYYVIKCSEDVIGAVGISHSTVQICSGKVQPCS